MPCAYDLGVTKSVAPTRAAVGTTVTWTVNVTNNGANAMSRGDTVTLADTQGGAGTNITNIQYSGGTSANYASGAITCNAAVGQPLPAGLVCSRPYSAVNAPGTPSGGVRGLNNGETLSITYTQVVPAGNTTLSNTASVTDRTTGDTNDSATANLTVFRAQPTATPNTSTGTQGAAQSSAVLADDTAGDPGVPLDPTTLTLLNGAGTVVTTLTIPNQGTYTIDRTDPQNPKLVFTPLPGYVGTPTPATYRVADSVGTMTTSTYTPTVTRVLVPDTTTGPQGLDQTVLPLANDTVDPSVTLVPGTLTLLDAAGDPATTVTVAGQGVYRLTGTTVTFSPEPQFTGTATPVRYQVEDSAGNTLQTTYTPSVTPVAPTAAPDTTTGPQGIAQSSAVLGNDTPGNAGVPLVPASLTLLNGAGTAVTTLTIPDQGVYSIDRTDPANPRIVFTPEPGFVSTATAAPYRVADANGTTATSTYTPTFTAVTPTATPDDSTGTQGAPQSVTPLGNDTPGNAAVPFVPSTLTLLNGAGTPVATVTIPNQGTYSIDRTVPTAPNIVFTPLPDYVGTPTPVDYRVADVNGTTASSTYTTTVTAVLAADGSITPQGLSVALGPLDNDTLDPTVTLVPTSLKLVDPATGDPVSTVTVNGQGSYALDFTDPTRPLIVFTPEPGFVGTADPIGYQVDDANGNTLQSTYTPVITPVTPVARPDTTSGPQGLPQSINPLTNDDPGNAAVPLVPASLTLLNAAGTPVATVTTAQGVYSIDRTTPATPLLVFTPVPGFIGTADPVDYRISDANGTPARSTYTPSTTVVTPTADPDVSSGPQGLPQSVDPLANDNPGVAAVPLVPATLTLLDTAGDPVATVTTAQGVYSIDRTDPAKPLLVFTPVTGFIGTADPVDYRIADANGTTATSTYTPTTTAVIPTANPDTTSGAQGRVQRVNPVGNDTPGVPGVPLDRSTLQLLDAAGTTPVSTLVIPGQGTYTVDRNDPANPVLVFTPRPDFIGTATPANYQVADANGTTATSTYTPTVTGVLQPDTTSGAQGQLQTADVLANDTLNPAVTLVPATLQLVDPSSNQSVNSLTVVNQGTYTVVDGKITFQPLPGFTGVATTVGYRVDDSAGNTLQSTYTPTVTSVTPNPDPDVSSGPQGLAQSVAPLVNDLAGDPAVPLVAASLTLLDAAGTPAATVTVGGQGTYSLDVTDPANPRIVFTPEPGFVGTATPVTYRVTDANGTNATTTYTPTVYAVVPAPTPDTSTGVQGAPQRVNPLANDAPGNPDVPLDPKTLTLLNAAGDPVTRVVIPGQGVYTLVNGIIIFTPDKTFTGIADPVTYRVSDVNGTPFSTTYTPTVTPVKPAPKPDTTSGPQGQPQSIDPLVNDRPGDPGVPLNRASLTLLNAAGAPVTRVVIAGQGVYTLVDGRIVFTPEPEFTGKATPVTYRIADANGTTATSTYTPTLTGVTPVAKPDATSGPQGAAQSIDPLVNDTPGLSSVPLDRDSLTLLDANGKPVDRVVVKGEGVYTVSADGRIVFTPEDDFTGTATPVEYRIADANGTTATSTYTPTVTPIVPVAAPDFSQGGLNVPQSVDPYLNDTAGATGVPLDRSSLTLIDAAGNAVDRIVVPGQGTYTVQDGKIVFTPVEGFTGAADPVTYRIADVNGTTATSTYTPTVLAGPAADVGNAAESGPIGSPVTVDPSSLVPNLVPGSVHLLAPGGTVTDRLVVPGEGVWVVDPATGLVTFTPEPGFTGNPTAVRFVGLEEDGTPVTGTLSVTYVAAPVPPAPPVPPTAPELPNTGVGAITLPLAGGALALILAGFALFWFGRRRRPGSAD